MSQLLRMLSQAGCLLPILSFALPLALVFKLCRGDVPNTTCSPAQQTPWWCMLLAAIAAYGGMIAYSGLDSWRIRREQRLIAKQRFARGYDVETHFFQPLQAQGASREIAEAILLHVREWCPVEDFPVEADDELMGEAIHMQAEDVYDTIDTLLMAFHKQPIAEAEEESSLGPIDTMTRLARFIHERPEQAR